MKLQLCEWSPQLLYDSALSEHLNMISMDIMTQLCKYSIYCLLIKCCRLSYIVRSLSMHTLACIVTDSGVCFWLIVSVWMCFVEQFCFCFLSKYYTIAISSEFTSWSFMNGFLIGSISWHQCDVVWLDMTSCWRVAIICKFGYLTSDHHGVSVFWQVGCPGTTFIKIWGDWWY